MNEIKLFQDSRFGNLRTIIKDGVPWFIASDVCKALEIQNPRQAVSRLDNDEKNSVILNDGTPGNPNKTIVSESGLYTLVLSSRKPEAHAFRRWVTHDVLPAIRQTGIYASPSALVEALQDPEAITALLSQLSQERSARIAADHHVTALSTQLSQANSTISDLSRPGPHIMLVNDSDAAESNVVSMAHLARSISAAEQPVSRARLFSVLRSLGYIQPDSPLPTPKAIRDGLLVIVQHHSGSSTYYTTGATVAGQLFFSTIDYVNACFYS